MIISKLNEKVKYIVALKNNQARDKYKEYFIEGVKLANEILNSEVTSEFDLQEIWYCKEILEKVSGGNEILRRIEKTKAENIEVDKNVFEYIADTITPQGILCVLKQKQMSIKDILDKAVKHEKFLILDKISDAGNMGTIIRTCLAFGICNILCTKGTVDIYNPKVIRSTMGAITKINVWYLDDEQLFETLRKLKNEHYTVVGTSLKAHNIPCDINNSKNIFVMGSEANGISKGLESLCDKMIKIPIEKEQESLNVAIATGILLYENYIKNSKNGL